MRRENLRNKLAEAIQQVMAGHALTVPNTMRYCNASVRASFSICKSTRIKLADWENAIEIVRARRADTAKIIEKAESPSRDPFAWKVPIKRRIIAVKDPESLDTQTRLRLLEEATHKSGYFSKLKALYSDGLYTV